MLGNQCPELRRAVRCLSKSGSTRVSGPMSPEEIRAAAETYKELGPGYHDAVIDSFLDKVSREIDARVAIRLAQQAMQPAPRRQRGPTGSAMALAVISMVLGIPISAIAVAAGKRADSTPSGLSR